MASPCAFVLALLFASFVSASRKFPRHGAFIGYSETDSLHQSDISTKHEEFLLFTTIYGDIRVRLFANTAPKAVQYLKLLVDKKLFDGCTFYRAEPAGDTTDTGHIGTRKGYALVQGGLYSCGRQRSDVLPVESAVPNKKGTVSLITGTSEFFFNLEDHLEWNGSFTAWGEVVDDASWQVLQNIVSLPTHEERHLSGTVLRILQEGVKFSVTLIT